MKPAWTEFRPRLAVGADLELAKMFGLFPFQLTNEGIQFSFTGGLCTTFSLAISLASIVAVFLEWPQTADTRHVTDLVQVAAFSSILLSVFLYTKPRRDSFSQFLSSVFQIEFALFKLGVEVESPRRVVCCLASLCVLWSACGLEVWSRGACSALCRAYLAATALLTCTTYTWAVGCLSALHGGLSAALARQTDPGQLVLLDRRLSSSCGHLLSCFSSSLLVFFSASFVICTTKAYLVVTNFNRHEKAAMIGPALWVLYCYTLCFIVIDASERAKEKAEEFDTELHHQILNVRQGITVLHGTTYKLRLHASSKPPFAFSAAGVFGINWRLATSMVTASCTYIIIMVQVSGN